MTAADALAALDARRPRIIAVGASAGAIEALTQILPVLPAAWQIPVVIVVHVPADRTSGIVPLFGSRCRIPVYEVEDKCPLQPAVYFAPPDYHVLVERIGTLALSADEPVHFSRPAIDVLFDSVAHAFGERSLGIVLSGASADGAAGLDHLRRAGALTWVQSPVSAAVATMPEAALTMAPHQTLTPAEMAQALAEWGGRA